jgi:hypothetical protein
MCSVFIADMFKIFFIDEVCMIDSNKRCCVMDSICIKQQVRFGSEKKASFFETFSGGHTAAWLSCSW